MLITRPDNRSRGRHRSVCALIAATVPVANGCGALDFHELTDFQRDLLIFGVARVALQEAGPGPSAEASGQALAPSGVHCWDVNRNHIDDPQEDINGDGVFDAADCQGAPGANRAGIPCWDLDGDGRVDAEEDLNRDGEYDAADCQGPPGIRGPSGRRGRRGSTGESLFHLYVDDFFASRQKEGAAFALIDDGAVAFRAIIPASYGSGNDVSMRLHLRSTSAGDDDCVVLTLDARRARAGRSLVPWDRDVSASIEGCNAEPGREGCGRRWIHVEPGSGDAEPSDVKETVGRHLVVDLPLNRRSGLDFPRDLQATDLVAFELGVFVSDGTSYELIGAELYESRVNTAVLSGASVHATPLSSPDPASVCDALAVR